jgi:hypothetical protein
VVTCEIVILLSLYLSFVLLLAFKSVTASRLREALVKSDAGWSHQTTKVDATHRTHMDMRLQVSLLVSF